MKSLFALLFSLLLSIVSHAQVSRSLIGVFSVIERGGMAELIRIEENEGGFTLSEKKRNKWLSAVQVSDVRLNAYSKVMYEPIEDAIHGLGTPNLGLFEVPKGWSNGKFVCASGYFLATMLGPIELYKQ